MIHPGEFRLGNMLMEKQQHRIVTAACNFEHMQRMATGALKDFFPVVLKAEWLAKMGFEENMKYPLLPSAREFVLVLPIQGSQENTIHAYIKSNGECFARAMQEGRPCSNPVYQVHQVQNLFYALTGRELGITDGKRDHSLR